MMRTEAPKDLEGRGFVNLARTTPELPRKKSQCWTLRRESLDNIPCGLVTLPQITRILVPRISF